jgi:molybdopterin synthase sulfur carrier subunit
MIRVIIPPHLRVLAHIDGEVRLEIKGQATQRSLLDALEANYPALSGTVRDPTTQKRRPLLRFYAGQEDLSNNPPDTLLPNAVQNGEEPFIIIAAVAGG